MTAMQSIIINPIAQTEIAPSLNTMSLVVTLKAELAALQAKVASYYHNDIVLRGDKILMREYRGHFGIEP